MALDTESDVEEVRSVQTADGEKVPPSNADAQGNWPHLAGDTYETSSTSEETLPSNAVPDGVAVLVHGLADNDGTVQVGPEGASTYPLGDGSQGYAVQVKNTDQIAVQASTAGDGVAYHFESQ